MRIALVILHADPARGGAERYTSELARALAERGEDVTLLAASFAGEEPPGVRRVELPAEGVTRTGRYERFLDALDAHLGALRPGYDIVHAMLPVRRCDVYHPHAGLAVEAVQSGHLKHATALRRAVARLGNQLNRRRRKFAAVERELLTGSRPPVVLCLSDLVKQVARKHYPLGEAHLAKLFNAVDLKRFDPAARPQVRQEVRERFGIAGDRVVALIIAQDFHRKGLSEAIAGVAQVDDPRLMLLVVGKEDPGAYRREAERRGIADRVIFAGATSDPAAFYAAADCFVLPTRQDPCSLVVLEALAMGLPVISTRANGACEIMQEAKHGFVLPSAEDVAALSGALRRMLDEPSRLAMGRACLELRPALSQAAHVDRLLGIYRQRVGRNSG